MVAGGGAALIRLIVAGGGAARDLADGCAWGRAGRLMGSADLCTADAKLLPPEGGGEKHDHTEDLETAEQHGSRADPGLRTR
jgi:hypothetical protein